MLEEEESGMPKGWRHLQRSLGATLGESAGLGFADRMSVEDCVELADFGATWLAFGVDYLDLVVFQVGRWREESPSQRAGRARIPTFDEWLQRSGRYVPGLGVWPERAPRR
ncbi:hypothetical protein [Promicromonospora sp. NPDC057488]|uniref:hypothetical protein n=1 Tax=Promicromonospora sp. NPDC057488 TaxID=3346147 RepID=UPI0036718416